MARLFPLRSETQTSEGQPRVVDLEGEDADAVFGALSSTTARRIYGHVAEEPATPSDVAETVDTSIQNVRYHLDKLEEAGLIEVVDTWYSSRGNEMSVYAASDGPLVVAADRSRADKLREALSRYLGGLAVLAGASLFVQYGVERLVSAIDSLGSPGFGGDDAGPEEAGDGPAGGDEADDEDVEDAGTDDGTGDDAADEETDGDDAAADPEAADDEGLEEDAAAEDVEDGDDAEDVEDADTGANESSDVDAADAPNETETPVEPPDTPTETTTPTDPVGTETPVDHAPEATDALLGTLPPGLIFFLGGLCVLTLVTVWWYRTPY